MEEHVGALWHRLVTRLADTRYQEKRVKLAEVQHGLSIFFRAMGGDAGLQVERADATALDTRRNWLQRIAGAWERIEMAWRDDNALRLPVEIACFDDTGLNRDLYFWLAALAALDSYRADDWLIHHQQLTRRVLSTWPGLKTRYQRLVTAHLAQRPEAKRLSGDERLAESRIRAALQDPHAPLQTLPVTRHAPWPVPLWLHPDPPQALRAPPSSDDDGEERREGSESRQVEDIAKRQAERVKMPEEEQGLITVRMENIFSMGEFVNVDRGTEDEEDADRAEQVARDLDKLSVARERKASAIRLKFDLDLPPESADDLILSDGILLPEWDWKRQQLLPDRCRVLEMQAADAAPRELPKRLTRTAKRLRNQFQALAPARTWHRAQPDGQEIDIDAYLRYASDRAAGHGVGADGLYRELRSGARDLACGLIADLSLSTDAYVDDHHQVIDVIRDSLYLFAESLHATGDRFGLYGFSSRKRDPIRIHQLKDFDESYNSAVRGRIHAIKPGYYTRLGAGIRYLGEQLKNQPAGRRLLLILTDGKPHDLDQYEGRYGIEDTRQAIIEARRLGLQPFCVTIDEKGNDYLPWLFGNGGYVVIRNPAELPQRLPMLYARLTQVNV